MRVACPTVDDFLTNLLAEGSERVYRKVVYVSITKNPVDGNKKTAIRWDVNFQTSAIIELEDEGQYLLEFGEDCGMDYHEAEPELNGTDHAKKLKNMILAACLENDLVVRPGIIDMS